MDDHSKAPGCIMSKMATSRRGSGNGEGVEDNRVGQTINSLPSGKKDGDQGDGTYNGTVVGTTPVATSATAAALSTSPSSSTYAQQQQQQQQQQRHDGKEEEIAEDIITEIFYRSNRNNKRKIQYRCDVCSEAVFENYDDAVTHEVECAASQERKRMERSDQRVASQEQKKKMEQLQMARQQQTEQQQRVALQQSMALQHIAQRRMAQQQLQPQSAQQQMMLAQQQILQQKMLQQHILHRYDPSPASEGSNFQAMSNHFISSHPAMMASMGDFPPPLYLNLQCGNNAVMPTSLHAMGPATSQAPTLCHKVAPVVSNSELPAAKKAKTRVICCVDGCEKPSVGYRGSLSKGLPSAQDGYACLEHICNTAHKCAHSGCKASVRSKEGLCILHESRGMMCKIRGCLNLCLNPGKFVCQEHEKPSPCSHPGCLEIAVTKAGHCREHLAKPCRAPKCTRRCADDFLYCDFHGGRVNCSFRGCSTLARANGMCKKHGHSTKAIRH